MNQTIKIIALVLILVFGISGLQAGDPVVLKLRLYQGVRDSTVKSGDIMDVYTLRKIADSAILTDREARKEQKSIIKIYSLNYAHMLYKLAMVLKSGHWRETGKGLVMNGRQMNLRIGRPAEKPDLFKVGILPVGTEKKPLLSSEIVIPANKTAVLGFEDSEGEVFFLAVSRIDNPPAEEKEPLKSVEYPRLTGRSIPPYPPEALDRGISGVVILECHTDIKGKVVRVFALGGPEELIPPSREAVMKWRYSPWIINGKPEPVRMHLVIFYKIIQGSRQSIDTSEEAISETLEKAKPLMKQWRVVEPVSRENRAILEVIIVEGRK